MLSHRAGSSLSAASERPGGADPLALLRSRRYIALLVLAAIIGVPVSAVAYFFLALVSELQRWIFTDLPRGLGLHGEPLWWPVLPLVLAGILVSLTIRYLPGKGGRSPAEGFKMGQGEGPPAPIELPGIVLAALATLSLGVVLGPEAPHLGSPTGPEFLWALAIGITAALLGPAIRRLGLFLRPHVERRMLLALCGIGEADAPAPAPAAPAPRLRRPRHRRPRSCPQAPAPPRTAERPPQSTPVALADTDGCRW